MSDNELDYTRIRQNVEQSLKKQKRNTRIGFFIANLIMFVIFMAISWGVALTNPEFGQMAVSKSDSPLMLMLILPTLGWAMGLFFNLMAILMDLGVMDKSMRERLVMREIGEELLRKGMTDLDAEKPKRRLAETEIGDVALSDDGELIPVEKTQKQGRNQPS